MCVRRGKYQSSAPHIDVCGRRKKSSFDSHAHLGQGKTRSCRNWHGTDRNYVIYGLNSRPRHSFRTVKVKPGFGEKGNGVRQFIRIRRESAPFFAGKGGAVMTPVPPTPIPTATPTSTLFAYDTGRYANYSVSSQRKSSGDKCY